MHAYGPIWACTYVSAAASSVFSGVLPTWPQHRQPAAARLSVWYTSKCMSSCHSKANAAYKVATLSACIHVFSKCRRSCCLASMSHWTGTGWQSHHDHPMYYMHCSGTAPYCHSSTKRFHNTCKPCTVSSAACCNSSCSAFPGPGTCCSALTEQPDSDRY